MHQRICACSLACVITAHGLPGWLILLLQVSTKYYPELVLCILIVSAVPALLNSFSMTALQFTLHQLPCALCVLRFPAQSCMLLGL